MAKHLKTTPPSGKKRARLPLVLFVLAAVLLLTSALGSAQAALTYFSEEYDAAIALPDIGITLVENGTGVSTRDYTGSDDVWTTTHGELLANMLAEGESLELGHTYDEVLAVTNSGNIDEYVRVKVYRYWTDADGQKLTNLDPALIDLHWVNTDGAWVEDVSARTSERSIFYYTSVLGVDETTVPLTDTLTVSEALARKVTRTFEKTAEGTVVTTTYDYDGVKFVIEAEADAVQTHNAEDAITSAWGVTASIGSDGSLSLG